jgi:PAS domain S-box-containing protein
MSDSNVAASPPCTNCGSADVVAMSVTPDVIFWSCQACGSIRGVPTEPMPRRFDADVERLRAGLQGDAARLDHVALDLERIAAVVLITDDTARYVAVNDKACELTGYPRRELLCKTIVDLTAAHVVDVYERLWDSFVRATKQHGFYKIKRKDGSVVDVKYCAYTDLAPGIHISFITTPQHSGA